MSGEYFVLEYPADNPKGYCILDDLEGFENDWQVGQGVSLASNPPTHLSMAMYSEAPRDTVLADHVENMDRLLIVSLRLKEFLVAQAVPDVEYYSLEIIDHKGKVASNEYSVAHLINHVDCIDTQASEVDWSNEGLPTQRVHHLSSLVIYPERIPEGRTLFFPKYYNQYPILHPDLAEAMENEGFTHVDIVPIEECAC